MYDIRKYNICEGYCKKYKIAGIFLLKIKISKCIMKLKLRNKKPKYKAKIKIIVAIFKCVCYSKQEIKNKMSKLAEMQGHKATSLS